MKKFVLFAILIGTVLSFIKLQSKSFTLDEVSSLEITKDWHTMTRLFWTDEANMWLYYFLLHFWQTIGQNELTVRALSVLFFLLSIPLFYKFSEKVFDSQVANLSVILWSTSLAAIFYSQTGRGYTLTLLLSVLMGYLLIKVYDHPLSIKYSLAYVLAVVLGLYSHFLLGLVLISHCIFIFIEKKIRSVAPLLLISFLVPFLMLPVIISPSFKGHQLDWLSAPKLVHLAFTYIFLSGDSVLQTLIFFFVTVSFLLINRKYWFDNNWSGSRLRLLVIWTIFPVTFSYIFSSLIKPIFQPEYFIFCLPPLILLVSAGLIELKKIKPKFIKYVTIPVIILISLTRLFFWYSEKPNFQWVVSNYSTRNWRNAAKYILRKSMPNDALISYAYDIEYPLFYYFDLFDPSNGIIDYEISTTFHSIGGGDKQPDPSQAAIYALSQKYPRVWLVLSYHDLTTLDRNKQTTQLKSLLDQYYKILEYTKLSDIEIYLLKVK